MEAQLPLFRSNGSGISTQYLICIYKATLPNPIKSRNYFSKAVNHDFLPSNL